MKPPVFNHQQYTDLEADYMILKAENEKLKAELAAAVADLKTMCEQSDTPCIKCKYYTGDYTCHPHCSGCGYDKSSKWEWRGLERSE